MNLQETAGIAGTVVLGAVMIFQALLALGLPLGHLAWGGKHRVLPWKLRWSSFASFFVLGFAAWSLLVRVGFTGIDSNTGFFRVIAWIFAGFFTLGIAMNAASRSRPERLLMTPANIILATCFFVAAAGM